MKEKISSLLKRIPLAILSAMLAISLTTIEARAEVSAEEAAAAIASDIVGVNGGNGGNTTTANGLSYSRTGYLVYLVDENGSVVSSTAAMKIDGYAGDFPNTTWIAESRKGHSVGQWESRAVPWKVPAFTNSKASNYAQIKSWMEGKDGNGVMNSVDFVEKTWTTAHAEKFLSGEYLLVLETLLHFQFQVPNGGSSKPPTVASLKLNVDKLYREKYNIPESGFIAAEYLDRLKAELNRILKQTWEANGGNTSSMSPIGPPLIGTTANMVKKYMDEVQKHGINWFAAYTNNTACFTMMIEPGGLGETYAKFEAWRGSTAPDYRMPNPDVLKYAVGTAVFKAKSGQTTYDESLFEDPGPPDDESDGKYSIVKNYRTKIGENDYEDDGCFNITNVAPEITIENEPLYKVVGWKISTTEKLSIPSKTWESSVPGSVTKEGKTPPPTVKLTETDKTLYVLLEKEEEEPPEPEDYNYLITESTITRRIKMSEPDNQLSMPDILNHTFKWVLPAHKTTCSGHTWTKECDGSHTRSVKVSDGCPDTCTEVHEHKGAEYGTENYNCGQNCKTQTAYCSGWDWKNKDLKLSLHNSEQNKYSTILATKTSPKNWFYNPNTNISKLVQGFYRDNNTFDRAATSQQIYENKNWDYICVIHRGQDKLNLAEWINNGQGQYDPTEAITNLQGVNNEVYQASNQSSGLRKPNGFYTDTFQVSIERQEHGVEQTDNETVYGPTTPSSVPGQSPLGATICPDDQRRATLTPLSFNVIVRVEVYKGLETTDKHDGFEDGHTSKPRGDYRIVSGRMIKGSNISFIPYILMKYDTIDEAITDAPAYVMGEHTRDMSLLHYGEIAWNKSSNPNLLSYYNYILLNTATPKGVFFIV